MHDRIQNIDGSVNLRDFGGHPSTDGRTVIRNRLFRSGTLTHLTDAGRRQFDDLDVRLICDLRRAEEKDEEPTPFAHGDPNRLEIEIFPGSAVAMRGRLENGELNLEERIDFMVSITAELAQDHAEDYAQMFEGMLDMDGGGFLVHCSAGKDRTGFACALILHALGVQRDLVVADYLFTNEAMDYEGYVLPRLVERFEPTAVPDREAIMALAGVRPEYLEAAYAAIDAEFDSVEHYLADAIGLDENGLETLRHRYLV